MSVPARRVGDVLRLERVAIEPDPRREYVSIGIRSFGKGIFHYEPKPGDQLGSLRFFELRPKRLVVSNIKGWEGAIAVSGDADAHTVASNRFLTYVPIDDEIDVRYARWYFLSERGIAQIQRASPGSADRNRTLAIERFEALEIPLPPVDEQRRVAAKLDRVAEAGEALARRRGHADRIATAVPLALRASLEAGASCTPTRLGDALELVKRPVGIDPSAEYVSIGVRSFGKGIFHYPRRTGDQIGKLRFQTVEPGLLVISNIKAWEGAVATSSDIDSDAVASNRFLFFRPVAGPDATHYFWSLLLGQEGLAALGQASPGSADRNRTLAVERFRQIKLPLPSPDDQAAIGRAVCDARRAVGMVEINSGLATRRIAALMPAALNEAFSGLG